MTIVNWHPIGNMKQVEILLPAAVDHGFDYAVPGGMELGVGDIVTVPFRKKESLGVVWGEGKSNLDQHKIKPVRARLDFPPFNDALRQFIDWAAWYNCAARGMALKMALPIGDIDKKGRAVVMVGEGQFFPAELSDAQSAAAVQLKKTAKDGFSVTLLDGVTGSGKTEVYFDTMAKMLKNQEKNDIESWPQILVLLPEIALSVQWLKRFEERFGFEPQLWHFGVSPAKKRATWQKVARGEVSVLVGARSALFLPYRNLKLIVVDEEHDQSYKQEDGVIYHARDMAVARARFEKIPIVLVSATPSLETYFNVKSGKYHELSLPARHGGAQMPQVEMLDMRKAQLKRGAFISEPLREALTQTMARGNQAMLFLNRRGYAPLVLCRACGHRFQCPTCSSWMVLHGQNPSLKGKGILRCHHCDRREPLPDTCPACGAKDNLHACGPGVERVLEEVKSFLPKARTALMASDMMHNYQLLYDTVMAIERGEVDIVIGTQMIAKGHHFAGLALVGVVDADLGLAGGDLRAAEKTYQLLHQLSGRAGREHVAGTVILQSFMPEHPVMKALLSGDRETFLKAELAARKSAQMPPYSRLAAIIVEGKKEEQVIQTAKTLASRFTNHDSRTTLLGPAPAPLYMLRGKYRYRLLIKADRRVNLPDYVRGWVEAVKAPSSVRIKIDIDPVGFL